MPEKGLAAFTHHMTQASHQLDQIVMSEAKLRADKVTLRADNAALRADNTARRMKNAALTVRLEVATKTVKRSKALAVKYYDLCVTSGVDAEVLDAVEDGPFAGLLAEESDEEAGESDEEAEESDEEAGESFEAEEQSFEAEEHADEAGAGPATQPQGVDCHPKPFRVDVVSYAVYPRPYIADSEPSPPNPRWEQRDEQSR